MEYEVIVLQEGYSVEENNSALKADGTITLVKGVPNNIIVDTGLPSDHEKIIERLAENGVTVNEIDVVVGTHGHSDHIGNLNLFPKAKFIVCYDICKGDVYEDNQLHLGSSYIINEYVEVVPTPGHTSQDISVVVKTKKGVIVIAGDLFEREEDLRDASIWKNNSSHPDMQEANRQKILSIADFVVPGHGPIFKVDKFS